MTTKLPIPQAALAQHIIALGKTGSGKSSKLRVLVEGLLDDNKPVCIIDPKGDWWGIKSSADGKHAGYSVVIFGGEHADVPLNPRAGAHVAELIATGNRPCLIDLGGWMVGERTRFFIDFASALFKFTRGPRHLVIDEVHNFAPQGKIMDPDAGKMLHWANRLASEGRGKGITILAASQRPQKVHKDFVTSCETLIACKVIHKLDRDSIKDWIDGCADPVLGKQVIADLAQMKKPEAWVWSPEIEFGPERIAFPMFKTYDSFRPQAENAAVKLKGWAEVDLEEVKSRLSTVLEEAKANDPAELKARIRELDGQIAKLKSAAPAAASTQTIDAARAEGFESGYTIAKREQWSEARNILITRLDTLRGDLYEHIETLQQELRAERDSGTGFAPPKPPTMTMHPAPAKLLPATRHALETVATAARERVTTASGEKLSKAERLVLTVLAQYPQGRTHSQVAVLTGYASTGGGFNNAIYSLRSRVFIDGGKDRLTITGAGQKALGPFDPLPHGPQLLAHWMRQLSKAERSVLEVLTKVYPKAVNREDLASMSGYQAEGGGYGNALSRLRTLELINGRVELKASDDLFE